MRHSLTLWVCVFLLVGCGASAGTATPDLPTSLPPTSTETKTPITHAAVSTTEAGTSTTTATPSLQPEDWQEWPVIPVTLSENLRETYALGQALGNDAHAYSKIGDCDATPTWFLGAFDGKAGDYSLGEYGYLQEAIDQFHGSHSRKSLASGNGFSSANVLTAFMADRTQCGADEIPLACELRIQRPSFALVSLGSNDIYHLDSFIANMQIILDTLIDAGVVPILASKADNLEGDHAINLALARLALEYDIPFWNFWLAVQPLPAHGLLADGAHLTYAGPFFDDPERMLSAWPWRNLTALQSLDLVWRWVSSGG